MTKRTLSGTLLDEQVQVTLEDIGHACCSRTEWVIELVDEGILNPCGEKPSLWRFPGSSITKAQIAQRLQSDLDINLPGVALILELLGEIDALRSLLRNQYTR